MAGSKAALLVATAEYSDPAFRQLRAPGHDVEALRVVLADPTIGGMDVRALVNQPGQLVEEEIEGFFAVRKPDDPLVQGRGRVVITASSAMEYAFETGQLTSDTGQPSVFTTAVVQGLQTVRQIATATGRSRWMSCTTLSSTRSAGHP